jgi:hypothetical protein
MARSTVSSLKKGHVAFGRVVAPDGKLDPELVLGQMEILPEGYFAGEVGDLERPLVFRVPGYSSLEVPLEGKTGELVYLGTVTLEPLAVGQAASLEGRVTLDDARGAHTATVQLSLRDPPMNTPNGAYPRGHRSSSPITVAVSKSGDFKATRLSPTDYSFNISAPGYVSQFGSLTLKPGETHHAETIALERPRQVAITYRVASRPPFTKARTERQTVLGGGGLFRANRQDHRIDLLFPQSNGKIRLRAPYQPCSLADLGPGKLDDFLGVDPASVHLNINPDNIVPQSGHVYLLNQSSLEHWVLFELEFDEKASGKGGRP